MNHQTSAVMNLEQRIRAAETDPRNGFGIERDAFCALFGSDDQREGMRAFLEKREARFGAAR